MTNRIVGGNRVPGHGLRNEGKAVDAAGWFVKVGKGRCECGAQSPELTSDNARKRWHREHKAEVSS